MVILAVTFLGQYVPLVAVIATGVMYLFILRSSFDGFLMWRGFKKVLAARLPKASPKGLLMYGMTRGDPDPSVPDAGSPDQARREASRALLTPRLETATGVASRPPA